MRNQLLRTLHTALLLLALGMTAQQTQAQDLTIGDSAPDFTLMGSDGHQHHLADYRGSAVVVAWFPKAFTGG